MSSRETILNKVQKSQPTPSALPEGDVKTTTTQSAIDLFKTIVKSIGGDVLAVKDMDEIKSYLQHQAIGRRTMTTLEPLQSIAEVIKPDVNPHSLENVYLSIVQAQFGVAENGAVWLTEKDIIVRVLPFITENLVIVLNKQDIVSTMHDAYDRISNHAYGFGVFLAGPSKTADIEQNLVLGAHGSKSLTILLLG